MRSGRHVINNQAADLQADRRGVDRSARSRELYERATEVIPGGVNSPVRAMRAVGRDPLFIRSASGAEITDVDGNRYIDYVCSWGPLILGHAHPAVVEAVTRAAERGTSFGAPTEAEIELAEEVAARVPSAEMVRLVSSGTEASMTAIRLARAATGRDRIVQVAGHYHGHVDGLLAESGSGLATQGIPASPGVTAAQAGDTIVVPWNDTNAFEAAMDESVAAVIAEPIAANMGLVRPRSGFLEKLRETCDATRSLLILDEVITGFRVARGGAQELLAVQPDLTILGKVLGGGLPLAAVAGGRELMEQLAPLGQTYQAGTLSGNPLATAAGFATLGELDDAAYARLAAVTARLAAGVAADGTVVAAERGLMTVFFSDEPVTDYAGAQRCDHAAFAAFWAAMLERRIYLPPSPYEAWFPSLAHTDAHLERTIEAAAESLEVAGAA
jgi:glutamate-1-semialdehyde 2,1-aminomutase